SASSYTSFDFKSIDNDRLFFSFERPDIDREAAQKLSWEDTERLFLEQFDKESAIAAGLGELGKDLGVFPAAKKSTDRSILVFTEDVRKVFTAIAGLISPQQDLMYKDLGLRILTASVLEPNFVDLRITLKYAPQKAEGLTEFILEGKGEEIRFTVTDPLARAYTWPEIKDALLKEGERVIDKLFRDFQALGLPRAEEKGEAGYKTFSFAETGLYVYIGYPSVIPLGFEKGEMLPNDAFLNFDTIFALKRKSPGQGEDSTLFEFVKSGLGRHEAEQLTWEKAREYFLGQFEKDRGVFPSSKKSTDAAMLSSQQEIKRGRIVGDKLHQALEEGKEYGSNSFLAGGYEQEGYGVEAGAAIDGSHAIGAEGNQGYYVDKTKFGKSGHDLFVDNVNDYDQFFKRRERINGKPIKLVIKPGIGGQYMPFQGIADVFNPAFKDKGRVVGMYELGEDYEKAIQAILDEIGADWDQIALIPSSKSGTTDETMVVTMQIMQIILGKIAQKENKQIDGKNFGEVVYDYLHEINFGLVGEEYPNEQLFADFNLSNLYLDLFRKGIEIEIDQLKAILAKVFGNMMFETTNRVSQSRLAAFVENAKLGTVLGEENKPVIIEMFDNVGGRWMGDLHMMTFLAFYGIDPDIYWQARFTGIKEVRDGNHVGNELGNYILDNGIENIALVLPDELFWFGKAMEQNKNESIWQKGFATLIAVKQSDWEAQAKNYTGPKDLVITLTKQDSFFAVDGGEFTLQQLIPFQLNDSKEGLAKQFAHLFTTFYGMTYTVGTRLIAREIDRRSDGRLSAKDIDINNLGNEATKIFQENLYLRQPFVEFGKKSVEKRLAKLQARQRAWKYKDVSGRNPMTPIEEALEAMIKQATQRQVETNIPELASFNGTAEGLSGLSSLIKESMLTAEKRKQVFVPLIYLGGGKLIDLRNYLQKLGIKWVMQGTVEQHISLQQVFAQPQKFLPFIISFVPEKENIIPGMPAIGFAKGYLDQISPNMLRDYFAEASYRDALTGEKVKGQGIFMRILDNPQGLADLKEAFELAVRGTTDSAILAIAKEIGSKDILNAIEGKYSFGNWVYSGKYQSIELNFKNSYKLIIVRANEGVNPIKYTLFNPEGRKIAYYETLNIGDESQTAVSSLFEYFKLAVSFIHPRSYNGFGDFKDKPNIENELLNVLRKSQFSEEQRSRTWIIYGSIDGWRIQIFSEESNSTFKIKISNNKDNGSIWVLMGKVSKTDFLSYGWDQWRDLLILRLLEENSKNEILNAPDPAMMSKETTASYLAALRGLLAQLPDPQNIADYIVNYEDVKYLRILGNLAERRKNESLTTVLQIDLLNQAAQELGVGIVESKDRPELLGYMMLSNYSTELINHGRKRGTENLEVLSLRVHDWLQNKIEIYERRLAQLMGEADRGGDEAMMSVAEIDSLLDLLSKHMTVEESKPNKKYGKEGIYVSTEKRFVFTEPFGQTLDLTYSIYDRYTKLYLRGQNGNDLYFFTLNGDATEMPIVDILTYLKKELRQLRDKIILIQEIRRLGGTFRHSISFPNNIDEDLIVTDTRFNVHISYNSHWGVASNKATLSKDGKEIAEIKLPANNPDVLEWDNLQSGFIAYVKNNYPPKGRVSKTFAEDKAMLAVAPGVSKNLILSNIEGQEPEITRTPNTIGSVYSRISFYFEEGWRLEFDYVNKVVQRAHFKLYDGNNRIIAAYTPEYGSAGALLVYAPEKLALEMFREAIRAYDGPDYESKSTEFIPENLLEEMQKSKIEEKGSGNSSYRQFVIGESSSITAAYMSLDSTVKFSFYRVGAADAEAYIILRDVSPEFFRNSSTEYLITRLTYKLIEEQNKLNLLESAENPRVVPAMLYGEEQAAVIDSHVKANMPFGYVPTDGIEGLNRLIRKFGMDMGLNYSKDDQVIVTPGREHTINILKRVLLGEGEKFAEIDGSRGENIHGMSYKLLYERTKFIVLSNGHDMENEQLEALWDFCVKNKIVLVVDETTKMSSGTDLIENRLALKPKERSFLVRILDFSKRYQEFSGFEIGALFTYNTAILSKFKQYAQNDGYTNINLLTQEILLKFLLKRLDHLEHNPVNWIESVNDETVIPQWQKDKLKPSETLKDGSTYKKEKALPTHVGASTYPASPLFIDGVKKALLNERGKQRELLAELAGYVQTYFKRSRNLEYKPQEIIFGMGLKPLVTDALYAIAQQSRSKGKNMAVAVASPYWPSYQSMVELARGEYMSVDTSESNNFKLTVRGLERSFAGREKDQKVIIINSPNNPSGSLYTKEELTEIARWALENNAYILSDEIYGLLTLSGEKHISIASLDLTERASDGRSIKDMTITMSGLTKEAAIAGVRLGFMAATESSGLLGYLTQNHSGNPDLIAIAGAIGLLKDYDVFAEYVAGHVEFLRKYRKMMTDALDSVNIPYIRALDELDSEGALYLFIDMRSLIGKYIPNSQTGESVQITEDNLFDAAGIFHQFTKDADGTNGIANVSGKGFGKPGFMRLSFATEKISVAAPKLVNFVKAVRDSALFARQKPDAKIREEHIAELGKLNSSRAITYQHYAYLLGLMHGRLLDKLTGKNLEEVLSELRLLFQAIKAGKVILDSPIDLFGGRTITFMNTGEVNLKESFQQLKDGIRITLRNYPSTAANSIRDLRTAGYRLAGMDEAMFGRHQKTAYDVIADHATSVGEMAQEGSIQDSYLIWLLGYPVAGAIAKLKGRLQTNDLSHTLTELRKIGEAAALGEIRGVYGTDNDLLMVILDDKISNPADILARLRTVEKHIFDKNWGDSLPFSLIEDIIRNGKNAEWSYPEDTAENTAIVLSMVMEIADKLPKELIKVMAGIVEKLLDEKPFKEVYYTLNYVLAEISRHRVRTDKELQKVFEEQGRDSEARKGFDSAMLAEQDILDLFVANLSAAAKKLQSNNYPLALGSPDNLMKIYSAVTSDISNPLTKRQVLADVFNQLLAVAVAINAGDVRNDVNFIVEIIEKAGMFSYSALESFIKLEKILKDKGLRDAVRRPYLLDILKPEPPSNVDDVFDSIARHIASGTTKEADLPRLKELLNAQSSADSDLAMLSIAQAGKQFKGQVTREEIEGYLAKDPEIVSAIERRFANEFRRQISGLKSEGGFGSNRALVDHIMVKLSEGQSGLNRTIMPVDDFDALLDSFQQPQTFNIAGSIKYRINFGNTANYILIDPSPSRNSIQIGLYDEDAGLIFQFTKKGYISGADLGWNKTKELLKRAYPDEARKQDDRAMLGFIQIPKGNFNLRGEMVSPYYASIVVDAIKRDFNAEAVIDSYSSGGFPVLNWRMVVLDKLSAKYNQLNFYRELCSLAGSELEHYLKSKGFDAKFLIHHKPVTGDGRWKTIISWERVDADTDREVVAAAKQWIRNMEGRLKTALSAQKEEAKKKKLKKTTSDKALMSLTFEQALDILENIGLIQPDERQGFLESSSFRRVVVAYPTERAFNEYLVSTGASFLAYVRSQIIGSKGADIAVLSSQAIEPPGGIDLNPVLLDMQIKRDGNGVPLPLFQQPIMEMKIEGFLPVIINITPVKSLPLLLGLADTKDNEDYGKEYKDSPMDKKARFEADNYEKVSYLN
ncbi:MAG: aminotransferase class I/II-fold pyridoxal phosphate-dependent enzyme, partial [Candidatus Omnitrophica bacterium]|nr:aminotransferase class I/II-fold pyridoxal phosphate-dependent enzyme [Candidatus Omnitrophota bacterium]